MVATPYRDLESSWISANGFHTKGTRLLFEGIKVIIVIMA